MTQPVTVPKTIQQSLLAIFGEEVDHVKILEYSWFARLHGPAIATTRRRRIYLRGSAAEFFADPNLMLHEYCHVLKQWEAGRLTVWRYVREWLRRGYWHNRFEIEARQFADTHFVKLCQLLDASPEQRLAAVEAARKHSQQRA
jgi:hypothetical protein